MVSDKGEEVLLGSEFCRRNDAIISFKDQTLTLNGISTCLCSQAQQGQDSAVAQVTSQVPQQQVSWSEDIAVAPTHECTDAPGSADATKAGGGCTLSKGWRSGGRSCCKLPAPLCSQLALAPSGPRHVSAAVAPSGRGRARWSRRMPVIRFKNEC